MGTLGDSTKRRMSAAIQGLGGTRAGFNPGASVGGYAGGMGGTFGRAARGIGGDPSDGAAGAAGAGQARPASAGRVRPPPDGPAARDPIPRYFESPAAALPSRGTAEGKREKVRPASAAHKHVWDQPKELPKAPPHGTTSGYVGRPKSATATASNGLRSQVLGAMPVEYRLVGTGLEPNKVSGGTRPVSASTYSPPAPPPNKGSHGSSPYGLSKAPPPALRTPQHHIGPPNSVDQMQELRAAEGDVSSPGTMLSDAHMMILEDAIRDAVRNKRSVYEGSKDALLKLFKAVDDGSGDVSIEEFISVCEQVGVVVSAAEAQALFRRHGYEGVMPYERFAYTLLTQPARQLAEDMPVRKGAFEAGQNANFNGKILYRQCRKPVYTPTDWDPSVAKRSAELPNARLILDFIYGYQGKDNTQQNLFYTSESKVVYFTAGVGVVYQRPPVHHQYFFLGHDDDITALTLCPAAVDFEGKQFPAKTLVATGQVTSTEHGAYICIWDSRTGSQPDGPAAAPEVTRLKFDKEARGFCALGFNPSGTRLAAVAMDNYHSVYVYDWRKKRELSSGRGQMGDPPQVYGLEWNPYEITHQVTPAFLTFGKKHIKLWTCSVEGGAGTWTGKSLSVGRFDMQNVTSAQWLPPRSNSGNECMIVAGMGDGQLYLFKGGTCVKAIAAHRPGVKSVQADGHPAYCGVRGLRAIKGGNVLLSGGADGTVLQWDTSDGSIAESRFSGGAIQLSSPFGPGDRSVPAVRAIDYSEELGRILVGTNNCDIVELTETTNEALMDGHSGDVWFVAFHPTNPNVFATVSDSGHVHVWDGAIRQMTHCVAMGWDPRTLAFSTKPVGAAGGYHIAVGSQKGQIKVLDEGENLRPVTDCKDCKEAIADIKYSPNCRFMAASSNETTIDVYNVEKGYQRLCRCHGHSATVRGIDWSTDSSVIMSNSNDLELLFWNARTGKQITLPQRDVDFATYTCMLGFPVMGIWPPYFDGLEVNSLDRSHDRELVVTSDDHGMVKLFNYPCVIHDAPHRAYRGHSSHVMCVRFNCNSTLVCSGGGHDWAVFQFRVVRIKPDDPPPPKPQRVWGALDESGRNYGYTTQPFKAGQPLAQGAPVQQPDPQYTANEGDHHLDQMPEDVGDEAASSGLQVMRQQGQGFPPRPPVSSNRQAGPDLMAQEFHGHYPEDEEDIDSGLSQNPAPLRMVAEEG
ncbi:hypothetical protein CEUSTIGMA_g9922.t1 [Chlamydomonas eustigma]|uniref:EML-like second beta-propeller domain-containing protein n=1 Tax=Chlamydomonas eustigma TaxID=1157962 RepID=A0A250XHD7_9CHLO|nr:hypothetical protein CEUSTIGMA_g9922.t1 [Chlamydomonas eustigma]|eukprot:GAX82495.1 hypothetical protein CEUSTIGMA_g9922.t1 [Chlamydomonas eustigma]